jgi:hypothetical protein
MQLNLTKLEEVAQAAFDAATERGGKDARRWQTAIAKAKQQLESNPYISLDGDGLLILSPDSLQIYRANGTCQCVSLVKYGAPCWHRAAYRLVKRYTETSH